MCRCKDAIPSDRVDGRDDTGVGFGYAYRRGSAAAASERLVQIKAGRVGDDGETLRAALALLIARAHDGALDFDYHRWLPMYQLVYNANAQRRGRTLSGTMNDGRYPGPYVYPCVGDCTRQQRN